MIKLLKSQPLSSDVHVRTPAKKKHDKGNLKRLKEAFDKFFNEEEIEKSNSMDGIYSMAQIVSGIDWELGQDGGLSDTDDARKKALDNLSEDPDFYLKKRLQEENGINLDLGSGQSREPGYLGLDLYQMDYGTIVDDMELGLPYLNDECCQNIRMSNVPEMDPKVMLSTVQRLLMPDGKFSYEGPSEIQNLPPHMKEVHKESVDQDGATWYKQKFQKLSIPDAAISNDAEPRIGIAQYDQLPSDALLAVDATGYYNSDGTSSARGNRVHGYPSQGALVEDLGDDNTGAVSKGGPGSGVSEDNTEEIDMPHSPYVSVGTRKSMLENMPYDESTVDMDHITHAGQKKYVPKKLEKIVSNWDSVKEMPIDLLKVDDDEYHVIDGHHRFLAAKEMGEDKIKARVYEKAVRKSCRIFKADKWHQIIYCVVLSPDETDLQEDIMTPEEIENTAHNYLIEARVVGNLHAKKMDASVVESYIAPVDFNADGQYGPQLVKKGAWVIAIKVNDPKEWEKVLSGEFTGVSVGGMGSRIPI